MSEKIKRFRWTVTTYIGNGALIMVPGGCAAGTYDITMEPVEPERVGEKGPAPEPVKARISTWTSVCCPECGQVMLYIDDGKAITCCGHTYKTPTFLLEPVEPEPEPVEPELKPCPHCGQEVRFVYEFGRCAWMPEHPTPCVLPTTYYSATSMSRADIIAAWNRRAE